MVINILEEYAASIFRAEDFSDILATIYRITRHHIPAECTLKSVCKLNNDMKVYRTYCSCDVHSGSDISMFLLPTHMLSTPSSVPFSPIMSHSFPVKVYCISTLQTYRLWNLALMKSTKNIIKFMVWTINSAL